MHLKNKCVCLQKIFNNNTERRLSLAKDLFIGILEMRKEHSIQISLIEDAIFNYSTSEFRLQ